MKLEQLKGKRVAIWGAGREGMALAALLSARLPQVSLTILDDAPLTPGQLDRLAELGISERVEGDQVGAALSRFDVVFKSPGISRYRADIQAAAHAGVLFSSGAQLWFDEHPDALTICVTGTKGKSTTASLLAAILRHLGKNVVLAGNIGVPLADIFDRPGAEVYVIELSSYQTADLDIHPSIALLLNLFPEHLDWHGSVEQYYADKLRLFRHSRPGQAVINARDEVTARCGFPWRAPVRFNQDAGLHVSDGYFFEGGRRLFPAENLPLPGEHNLSNICAALTVVRELGLPLTAAREAIMDFQPLPHRFQRIATIDGVEYVDDSISTIPQAAVEAMKAAPNRPLTVLLGGHDREVDYAPLIDYLVEAAEARPITAVCMGVSGRRLHRQLTGRRLPNGLSVHRVDDLPAAVVIARRETPAGGMVLLSPAAPSYGEFGSFAERGEAFRQLVLADPQAGEGGDV